VVFIILCSPGDDCEKSVIEKKGYSHNGFGFFVSLSNASAYKGGFETICGFVADDFQVNNVPLPTARRLFETAFLELFEVKQIANKTGNF
jgi:hypothetical protein